MYILEFIVFFMRLDYELKMEILKIIRDFETKNGDIA